MIPAYRFLFKNQEHIKPFDIVKEAENILKNSKGGKNNDKTEPNV